MRLLAVCSAGMPLGALPLGAVVSTWPTTTVAPTITTPAANSNHLRIVCSFVHRRKQVNLSVAACGDAFGCIAASGGPENYFGQSHNLSAFSEPPVTTRRPSRENATQPTRTTGGTAGPGVILPLTTSQRRNTVSAP